MAMNKDSDSEQDQAAQGDLENYKGIYFGDKTEKYQDPVTGCHFRYTDLCQRLMHLKEQRKVIDKRLGLVTSSKWLSPKEAQTAKQGKHHEPETSKNQHNDREPNSRHQDQKQSSMPPVKQGLSHYSSEETISLPKARQPPKEVSRNQLPELPPQNSLESILQPGSDSQLQPNSSNTNNAVGFLVKRNRMRLSQSSTQKVTVNAAATQDQRNNSSEMEQVARRQQEIKSNAQRAIQASMNRKVEEDKKSRNMMPAQAAQTVATLGKQFTMTLAPDQIRVADSHKQNANTTFSLDRNARMSAVPNYLNENQTSITDEGRQSIDANKLKKEDQIRAHLQKLAQKQKRNIIDLSKTAEIGTAPSNNPHMITNIGISGNQDAGVGKTSSGMKLSKIDSRSTKLRNPNAGSITIVDREQPPPNRQREMHSTIQADQMNVQRQQSMQQTQLLQQPQRRYVKKSSLSRNRNKLASMLTQQVYLANLAENGSPDSKKGSLNEQLGPLIEVQKAGGASKLQNMLMRRTRNSAFSQKNLSQPINQQQTMSFQPQSDQQPYQNEPVQLANNSRSKQTRMPPTSGNMMNKSTEELSKTSLSQIAAGRSRASKGSVGIPASQTNPGTQLPYSNSQQQMVPMETHKSIKPQLMQAPDSKTSGKFIQIQVNIEEQKQQGKTGVRHRRARIIPQGQSNNKSDAKK